MPIDLYLVNLLVGNEGMPGAPLLQAHLAVDAPTGHITGQAEISQALPPPHEIVRINNLHGRIRSLGLLPAVRVVSLEGSYTIPFPPPAIGELVVPFKATLIIAQDKWEGRGSFSYGGNEVDDVPVKACKA